MDIEKIITNYCKQHGEDKRPFLAKWLRRIENAANGIPLEEALVDRRFIVKCFIPENSNTVSRAQYYKIKNLLIYLLDECDIELTVIPTYSELIENAQMNGYFENLTSVLSFIDRVGENTRQKSKSPNAMSRIKAVATLAWVGFTPEEIVNLTTADLKLDTNAYIKKGEEDILISMEAFGVLSTQAKNNWFIRLSDGKKWLHNVQTDALIKDRAGEPVTLNGVYQIFKNFNDYSNSKRVLSFKSLKLSHCFESIYNDGVHDNLIATIQKRLGCEYHSAFAYKRLYLQWVKTFHNQEA